MTRSYIALALLALLALGGWWLHNAGYRSGVQVGKVEAAQSAQHVAELAAQASEAARKAEHAQAAALDAIARQYEQDKRHAQTQADRVIADLRAGNLRLREQWACPASDRVPATPARAGELDAGAADREESASRIVRAAAECDAQVRGLQEAVRAMR